MLTEHHGTPLNLVPSPHLFLAAASQRTTRIRLGTLVTLLPLYNPVRLIEEVGMLEHLLPRLCAEDASRTKTSRQRAPQGAISSSPAPDCETGLVAAYGDEFAAVGASLLAISLRRSGRLSALLHDH